MTLSMAVKAQNCPVICVTLTKLNWLHRVVRLLIAAEVVKTDRTTNAKLNIVFRGTEVFRFS